MLSIYDPLRSGKGTEGAAAVAVAESEPTLKAPMQQQGDAAALAAAVERNELLSKARSAPVEKTVFATFSAVELMPVEKTLIESHFFVYALAKTLIDLGYTKRRHIEAGLESERKGTGEYRERFHTLVFKHLTFLVEAGATLPSTVQAQLCRASYRWDPGYAQRIGEPAWNQTTYDGERERFALFFKDKHDTIRAAIGGAIARVATYLKIHSYEENAESRLKQSLPRFFWSKKRRQAFQLQKTPLSSGAETRAIEHAPEKTVRTAREQAKNILSLMSDGKEKLIGLRNWVNKLEGSTLSVEDFDWVLERIPTKMSWGDRGEGEPSANNVRNAVYKYAGKESLPEDAWIPLDMQIVFDLISAVKAARQKSLWQKRKRLKLLSRLVDKSVVGEKVNKDNYKSALKQAILAALEAKNLV